MTMDNTGYIALSHQMALQRQMEVIANNLANANTAGYKADETLFEEFLVQNGQQGSRSQRELSFVQDFGVLINFSDGALEATGNPYDVGLKGPGFFVAQTPSGRVYTRGGHLGINDQGQLATAQGHPILDDANRPINIDPALGPFIINGDGSLVQGDRAPVRFNLVEFANPQQLRRQGGGYFTTTEAERPSTNTRTVQTMVEGSNVEPILQLSAMIETSRAYQNSQKLIDTEHELQRKVAERMPALRS